MEAIFGKFTCEDRDRCLGGGEGGGESDKLIKTTSKIPLPPSFHRTVPLHHCSGFEDT